MAAFTSASAAPRASEQHEAQVGIGPGGRHHLEQEEMALVRVGDRREHEHPAATEPVVAAELERRRRVGTERGLDAVRYDDARASGSVP